VPPFLRGEIAFASNLTLEQSGPVFRVVLLFQMPLHRGASNRPQAYARRVGRSPADISPGAGSSRSPPASPDIPMSGRLPSVNFTATAPSARTFSTTVTEF